MSNPLLLLLLHFLSTFPFMSICSFLELPYQVELPTPQLSFLIRWFPLPSASYALAFYRWKRFLTYGVKTATSTRASTLGREGLFIWVINRFSNVTQRTSINERIKKCRYYRITATMIHDCVRQHKITLCDTTGELSLLCCRFHLKPYRLRNGRGIISRSPCTLLSLGTNNSDLASTGIVTNAHLH